jgi:hypothetical protein
MENAQHSLNIRRGRNKRAHFHRAEICGNGDIEIGTQGDDNLVELDVESAVEMMLLKAHLRRIRNFYAVLAEVCQRDEKLLAL